MTCWHSLLLLLFILENRICIILDETSWNPNSRFYVDTLSVTKAHCTHNECNLLGTQQDQRGVAICNPITNGCLCKIHVTGRICNECEVGFFNLQSGRGCQRCNCDPIGSLNETCDAVTGQCYCRSGIAGLRCDHCKARLFGFSREGCKDCNCDSEGSRHSQCSENGQCSCFDNVKGQHCNKCEENKYKSQGGCIDCPDCYKLIKNTMQSEQKKILQLNDILNGIEYQSTQISDEEIANNLFGLEKDIRLLLNNVTKSFNPNGFYREVKNIIETNSALRKTLKMIDENIYFIDSNNLLSKNHVRHTNELLDEALENIEVIKSEFEETGVQALKNAEVRAEFVGQHSEKMLRISIEARNISDALEKRVIEIVDNNSKLKLDSINAYNSYNTAIQRENYLTETIKKIKNEIQESGLQLHSSKEWVREVNEKAKTILKNSNQILTETENLIIPSVDVDKYKENANNFYEKIELLRNKSEVLFEERIKLKNTISQQLLLGTDLLQESIDQQKELEELKYDLRDYNERASGAIKLCDEIWHNAKSSYQILEEFDNHMNKTTQEATIALQNIKEIQTILHHLPIEISIACEHLNLATQNAHLALQKAQQANALAKNASIKAENVKHESEILYKNSSGLVEEAGLMYDRVQNTEGELHSLIEKTKSNSSMVNEAHEKIGRAGKDTEVVSVKIRQLLLNIEKIMKELQNSPNIRESDVDRLENQIKVTEERIRHAKLEERLQQLNEEKQVRGELMNKYRDEITLMQMEVEHIARVIEALPKDCYRRVELEP